MKFSVISCSASEGSVSRVGAAAACASLQALGHQAEVLDVRSIPAFRVTSDKMNDAPHELRDMAQRVGAADGVVICYPIYCYTASASAKALTELLGPQLEEKPVATIVAAGSLRSHLATGDLMLSMMYEQSTFCFPKSVLLTSDDLVEDRVVAEASGRLDDLCEGFSRFTDCLAHFNLPRAEGARASTPISAIAAAS
ncbi:MAG: NAD(P)H-dependent oxidoreductase [Paracoccaceae bacterium]